ncbi:hypothetical protein L1987_66147 [Smallanthus sonchifolius]|uniref:Uncharacterized protein n=1 Tax=Smallanthus sonchifolius TaxID=185202 RepID=A0ACB9BWH1_9ASTR|nr:hypothetical protein L1987_66147 [Smallanthus sonchifolius]
MSCSLLVGWGESSQLSARDKKTRPADLVSLVVGTCLTAAKHDLTSFVNATGVTLTHFSGSHNSTQQNRSDLLHLIHQFPMIPLLSIRNC